MQWWNRLRASLKFLLRRRDVERQLDDEVRAFVGHRADALAQRGLPREAAERKARVEARSVEQVKEEMRDVYPGGRHFDSLGKDLRYALRTMRNAPGFTAVAVLTLALGIGGTSAIFTVVKGVLIDPLPYGDPSRLVLVWNELGQLGAKRAPGSPFELQELRARARSFAGIGGIWASNGTFLGEGEPEQVKVGQVTGNFFEVLAAPPLLGRVIQSGDEGQGKPPVIVLSHGLWTRHFGADPAIIGQPIRMDGGNRMVVGVMPPQFHMAFPPDAQVPAEIQAWYPFPGNIYAAPRDLYYLRYVARLRDGVTLEQADGEVAAVAAQLREGFAEFARGKLGLHVVPMHGDAVREIRPALLALFSGIALVLLIACVNVANLLLARATARRKEIALRSALGASRGRVFRQVLLESLTLASAGGVAGLVLGLFALRWLSALAPAGLLPAESLTLDAEILAFTVVVTFGAGLLFGIAPAWDSTRVNLLEALQETGHSVAAGLRRRSRAVLIVSEVALGFVLLVGAGLMIRTFIEVQRVDPGFRAGGVLALEMDLPGRRYPGDAPRLNLVRQVEEKLRTLPGVESVGGVSHLPLDDYPNWYGAYAMEGASAEEKTGRMADHRSTTPGYFKAVGAKLVAGRLFNTLDEEASRRVVVIDERLAREAWPGQDAVGKKIGSMTITNGQFGTGWSEVVGVIRHIQHHALTRQVRGQIYIPFSQSVRWHISFVVRTGGDPLSLAAAVKREIHSLDKDLAISKLRPMTFYLDRARAATRFTMVLAAIFGGLALLLAAVGIYGVLAYSVNQRTREFGIRLALGARPREVQQQVVREGMALAMGGLMLGACGAFALSRFLQALLFGVSALDPATYVVTALALSTIALAACWIPARRAARRDPLAILRAE